MNERIRPGPVDVGTATTSVSMLDPATGALLYRGYPVEELAAHCSVEQVGYLLLHGELPTPLQCAAFEAEGRAQRTMSAHVRAAVDLIPATAHPVDVLRTAVSVIGAADRNATDRHTDLGKALGLLSQVPAVLAYDLRRRRGEKLVEPRPELDYVENSFHMVRGHRADPVVVDAMRVSLILSAEHPSDASTFTVRVITSTGADLYSAVVGAIGALRGPRHGGAGEGVMAMLDQIGEPARVDQWLDAVFAAGRRVVGFAEDGREDSRVPVMRMVLERLVEHTGRQDLLALHDALEAAMAQRTGARPTLDYPLGLAHHLMGFWSTTFTPLVVAARLAGWTAHVVEQATDNGPVGPLVTYSGPGERHVGT